MSLILCFLSVLVFLVSTKVYVLTIDTQNGIPKQSNDEFWIQIYGSKNIWSESVSIGTGLDINARFGININVTITTDVGNITLLALIHNNGNDEAQLDSIGIDDKYYDCPSSSDCTINAQNGCAKLIFDFIEIPTYVQTPTYCSFSSVKLYL